MRFLTADRYEIRQRGAKCSILGKRADHTPELASGGFRGERPEAMRAESLVRPALFFRLRGEQQRVALGAAGVGGARRLGFGDVLGEHEIGRASCRERV